MKIFYGYRRKQSEVPEGMDQVFNDDEHTNRQEREDLAIMTKRDADVPGGDDIYIIALSDLGKGAEVTHVKAALEAEGNRIHVLPQEPKEDGRGRPAVFTPTPEQDKKIMALYRSMNAMRYVLDRTEQIMGARYEAHHLKRRYGNRWKKQKEQSGG